MAGIRTRNRLKALAVEKVSTPGIYADGGGLNLIVTDTGARKWELRIAIGGRRRQLGLGIYPGVSLEDARSKATQIRIDRGIGRGHSRVPIPDRDCPARSDDDPGLVLIEHQEEIDQIGRVTLQPPSRASLQTPYGALSRNQDP